MSIPFVDRPPTESEIERFRLFLSSYQERVAISFSDEPVSSWLFKDVLIAAFNIPNDGPISSFGSIGGSKLVNRAGNYSLHFNSLYSYQFTYFCQKNLALSFSSSKYWNHLAQFGITQQNYKDNPAQVYSASLDLIKSEEKDLFEKAFYLLLFVELDPHAYDEEKELCFYLAQYPYPPSVDLATVHWLMSEEENREMYRSVKAVTLLRGYEHDDLVLEIEIPEVEPTPLSVIPAPDRKKQKARHKSMLEYGLHRSRFSDQTIKIRMFLPASRKVWQSKMLQIEKLSTLQIMEYGAIAAIKKQRECAVAQLECLIKSDAKEEDFQQLLEKNWWMFGNEYGELIGQREIALGSQQDFLAKRTADGFLEIIEIKKPLNGKNLIYKTNQGSHARSHYRQELSDAIAQVIDYIDEIENDKHSIYYKEKIEVEKIRAKIIIGRDGDEKQKRSLRHLNSALHGIEILTYDQLLRIAKKSLEYQ